MRIYTTPEGETMKKFTTVLNDGQDRKEARKALQAKFDTENVEIVDRTDWLNGHTYAEAIITVS